MGWYSWKWNVSHKEYSLHHLGCLVLCCIREVDSEKVTKNLLAREVEDKVSEGTSSCWILLLIAYLFAQHLGYCLDVFQRGKITAALKYCVIYTYHVISLGFAVSTQKLRLWLLHFSVLFSDSRKYQELAAYTCQKFSGFLHSQNTWNP